MIDSKDPNPLDTRKLSRTFLPLRKGHFAHIMQVARGARGGRRPSWICLASLSEWILLERDVPPEWWLPVGIKGSSADIGLHFAAPELVFWFLLGIVGRKRKINQAPVRM